MFCTFARMNLDVEDVAGVFIDYNLHNLFVR